MKFIKLTLLAIALAICVTATAQAQTTKITLAWDEISEAKFDTNYVVELWMSETRYETETTTPVSEVVPIDNGDLIEVGTVVTELDLLVNDVMLTHYFVSTNFVKIKTIIGTETQTDVEIPVNTSVYFVLTASNGSLRSGFSDMAWKTIVEAPTGVTLSGN